MTNIFNITVSKTNQQFNIDFEALPKASQDYVIQYGLKQCLNDCHSAFKDVDHAKAQVEMKVEALRSGTVSLRAIGERIDPVTKAVNDRLITLVATAAKMTRKNLIAKLKASGQSIREYVAKQNGGEAMIAKFTKEEEASRKKLAAVEFDVDLTQLDLA
jgi:hypothetical protein